MKCKPQTMSGFLERSRLCSLIWPRTSMAEGFRNCSCSPIFLERDFSLSKRCIWGRSCGRSCCLKGLSRTEVPWKFKQGGGHPGSARHWHPVPPC